MREERRTVEFAMTLGEEQDRELTAWAKERGVSKQEFLRNVVIPDWIAWKKGPVH